MKQKAILRLIIKEAEIFSSKKQSLEEQEKQLSADAKEIKEKLAEAKDIKEKDEALYEEKVAEVRELADKRKESYKRVQKEKFKLKDKIKKAKERIIAKLKANQKEIFENRHKFEKLTSEDVNKLKDERKKLKKELNEIIGLKNTTQEELKEMSEEDRKKVKEAQKKYKENTDRIDEIDDKLNMVILFDGKTPQEMFKRNKLIIEKVEETFSFDKIDTIISKEIKTIKQQNDKKKKTKAEQQSTPKQTSEAKGEQQSQPTPRQTSKEECEPKSHKKPEEVTGVKTEPQQIQPPNNTQNNTLDGYSMNRDIIILENEGVVIYNFGNQKGVISLDEVKEDKKDMFKDYGIRKIVGFRAARRVNPAIIKVFEQIENGDQMIGEYLQSIKGKGPFDFRLNHDLTGLNIFQRISRNRQIKREQKCGAIISREELYEYNNPMPVNTQLEGIDVASQPKRRKQRTMDSYVNVRKNEDIMNRIEQVEENARQAIGKEVQDIVNEGQTQGEEVTI